MSTSLFHCKKFSLHQSPDCFKVGTDAALLGAFLPNLKRKTVLDLGTGTGILSFFALQKEAKGICGIDISDAAIKLAKRNAEEMPFTGSIRFTRYDIDSFESEDLFDVIVSNPPYFLDNTKSKSAVKTLSRHVSGTFPHSLFNGIKRNLGDQGIAYLVYPFRYHDLYSESAMVLGLYPQEIIYWRGKADGGVSRVLAKFGQKETIPTFLTKSIRDVTGEYTCEYTDFVSEVLEVPYNPQSR